MKVRNDTRHCYPGARDRSQVQISRKPSQGMNERSEKEISVVVEFENGPPRPRRVPVFDVVTEEESSVFDTYP